MARRAWANSLRGLALGLGAGLWACGAGGDAEPAEGSGAEPGEREVAPEARYQFVPTPEGMVIEAVSEGAVQSFSCPTRTCAGLCDECAARACEAAGELGEACAALVSNCNETCRCGGPEQDVPSCGFPVCAVDRMICYVGEEGSPGPGSGAPGGPAQDEPGSPFGPSSPGTSRPSF